MSCEYFLVYSLACLFLIAPLTAAEETNCTTFFVSQYEYNKFYDLSLIEGVQSEDYYAKLPVTFESNIGDIHVAFSESKETINTNRVYEFLLGGYGNTLFEIRRKDVLHEKRNFNGNRFADYRVNAYRPFGVEFSISKSGVIQIEMDSQFKFNLTDQLPVIPVKYVSFAGYMGSESKVTFDCVNVTNDVATTTESSTETATEIRTETTAKYVSTTTEKASATTAEIISTTTEKAPSTIENVLIEQPKEGLLYSPTEDAVNEIAHEATDEESIELTTSAASGLL